MSGENIDLTVGGNTKPLDSALQRSAQRQRQIAQMTAREIGQINDQMDRETMARFQSMGARGAVAAEGASKPFVRLAESMQVFSGVALRTGSVVGASMMAIVMAARRAKQALDEARSVGVDANRTAGGSALSSSQALAAAGVRDVGRVQGAAERARGSATQEQIDAFIAKFADLSKAGVTLGDDEAIDLVQTFARNQAVLGDGSGLLAARALRGPQPGSKLADIAVGYRVRTGSDLSLNNIAAVDKDIARAQEDLAKADAGVEQANRGGSVSALQSARDRRGEAAAALEAARRKRSDLFNATNPNQVAGITDAALGSLGTRALQEVGVRTAERDLEVQRNATGALPAAQAERLAAIQAESRALSRDGRRIQGDNLGANVEGTLSAVTSAVGLRMSDGTAAADGINRLVAIQQENAVLLSRMIDALHGEKALRPEAQRE